MIINTRDFGEQEIAEENILNFPEGIYAFEDQHRFVMLSPLGNDVFPAWLQSLDNENLCFIVFDPRQIVKDYSVTADAESVKAIEKKPGTDIRYLSLAVVPEEYKNTTVNLKSPIMINADKMLAAQIIAVEDYPIKFPVFKKEGE
ncbi:MAG: flagellar assembly protein FliW [Ruminococcus sp.]|nr:flagellar assembly protein FliW [Ruminococcus sp.]MCM1380657.1 flagellar assembly protein FliW [Muribaculaceae bacterium]MCM1479489.1 flagellar assembly protein FliW [Muribaculaceae bacterium]